MADRVTSAGVLRFGGNEVDLRSGELRRNGSTIRLADQPLQLLTTLLDRPGDVVTREELRQKLWPADTFVDFEHGLNAAVKRLRDALGDSATAPTFIETVPRRGYRFLVPLEQPSATSQSDHSAPERALTGATSPSNRGSSSVHGRWRPYVPAMLAAASLAAGWWWPATHDVAPAGSGGRTPAAAAARKRLTFGAGLQINASWSPDGRRLAYASDADGNFDIWVQAVDGGAPVRLTSAPEPDTRPAWSPAGDEIVFRSERDNGGLFVVRSTGGPARRLTSFGTAPAWLPDGRHIIFADATDGYLTRLYTVPAGGGELPRDVLQEFLRGGGWHSFAPHPDGRVSIIGIHRQHRMGIFTLALDGTRLEIARPVLDGWYGPRGFATMQWAPSGSALYIEAPANGVPTVWRVPIVAGSLAWGAAARLTDGTSSAVSPSLSAQGQLAFTSRRQLVRAWAFPFDPAAGRITGPGRPVSEEDLLVGGINAPAFPERLAFVAARLGESVTNGFVTDLATGVTRQIAPDVVAAQLSPDGRQLAYMLERLPERREDAARPANEREYSLAIGEGDGSQRLIAPWSIGAAMIPTDWTPDGRRVLGTYTVPPYTGTAVIATWPADRLSPRPDRVLVGGDRRVWQAKFSPNGRWISFVAETPSPGGGVEIAIVPASGATERQWTRVASGHVWPDKPRWAPDGRTLYFISRERSAYFNVWGVRIDPATGMPVGEPFQVTHFASPELMIDPAMDRCEIAVTRTHLVLGMQSSSGSIWSILDAAR